MMELVQVEVVKRFYVVFLDRQYLLIISIKIAVRVYCHLLLIIFNHKWPIYPHLTR